MSGGYYDRVEFGLITIRDTMKDDVDHNVLKLGDYTLEVMNTIIKKIEEVHELIKVADYLFAYDISEDTFLERTSIILKSIGD